MSGHEQERLSAFLDDELAPAERAAVEQHLAACAECQARLGELAAADRAAASLPAEPPAGYFESFPGRVRARLEARRTPRGLPAWTWAAAAVLLLAVVTPLTLSRRAELAAPRAQPTAAAPVLDRAMSREQPAPAAAAQEAAAPPAAAAPLAAVPEPKAAPVRAYGERAEKKTEAAAPRPPAAAEPAPATRQDGFAAAPGEADAREAAATARPLEPQASAPARDAVGSEEEAVRVLDEAAAPEARTAEGRGQSKRARDALASTAQAKDDAAAGGEAGLGSARAGAPAAAGVAASPRMLTVEDEWQRLDSARPSTAVEWRELREEWRHFAARRPDAPRADEARVRVVEAGREAWRASGEATDEAVFRRDAAAYLAREDAAQPERVRRLLR